MSTDRKTFLDAAAELDARIAEASAPRPEREEDSHGSVVNGHDGGSGGAAAGKAVAPSPSKEPEPRVDLGEVRDALCTVIDPEVGLDIVTLGLIYTLREEDGVVRVTYTLTTPGCPMEAYITNGIVAVVSAVEGVQDVEPDLVWEPRWDPSYIQEGAW